MTLKTFLFRLTLIGGIVLAGYLIYRGLSRYSPEEIADSLSSIPMERVLAAIGFAACSYLCLSLFDALALLYVGKPLAYRRVLLASFVSLGIGHNVGIASLSSGAVRYRYYSRWGLNAGDVAKLVLFTGTTVCLGLATLGGLALFSFPHDAEGLLGVTAGQLRLIAIAALAFPALYVVLSGLVSKPLRWRKWSLELPSARIALTQIVVGAINFAFVAACLYQLVAVFTDAGYLRVASIYVLANSAAIATHVPGGIGVLEAGIQTLLSASGAVGALIAFRAVYFFLPLAIALPMFAASEHVLRNADATDAARPPRSEAGELAFGRKR